MAARAHRGQLIVYGMEWPKSGPRTGVEFFLGITVSVNRKGEAADIRTAAGRMIIGSGHKDWSWERGTHQQHVVPTDKLREGLDVSDVLAAVGPVRFHSLNEIRQALAPFRRPAEPPC